MGALAIGAVHSPSTSSLAITLASISIIRKWETNLDTWLVRQAALHLHQAAGNFVANTGLAAMMLHGGSSGSVMRTPVCGHWSSSTMSVMAYTTRMRLGGLCCGVSASDGVLGMLCVHFRRLLTWRRALAEAIHDTWLALVCWACSCHSC